MSPKEMAEIVLRSAELREKSWSSLREEYSISFRKAIAVSIVEHKQSKDMIYPLYMLMMNHWNEVIDWARDVVNKSEKESLMSIKIKKNNKEILPKFLKDGQLAYISSWPGMYTDIGKIVQRHGDELIIVGKDKGECWSNISDLTFYVTVIPNGTELVVTDNE